jgi:hypothetical protein
MKLKKLLKIKKVKKLKLGKYFKHGGIGATILFFFCFSLAYGALTFSSNSISGTDNSTIDVGSSKTLSLQTLNNGPITTGSGLTTIGGRLQVGTTVLDGKTFNCPGNYATLNACLDAAKAYVTANNDGTGKAVRIVLPDGVQSLTGPYTLQSGMQIVGIAPRLKINSTDPTDADLSMAPNGGTWIDCGGGVCFTGSSLSGIALQNLGFKNFSKIVSFGGDGVPGVSFSTFEHIIGVGSGTVNVSDVGLEIYNFQHIEGKFLSFYNVNTGMHLIGQGNNGPGNSTFDDYYVYTYSKSSANGNSNKPGLWIEVKQPTMGTAGPLNYLHFGRTQVNSYSGDGTGVGVGIYGLNNSAVVFGSEFYGLDVEGALANGIYADYANNNNFVITGSALSGTPTAVLNLTANSQYNTVTSLHDRTTVVNPNNSNLFYGLYNAMPTSGTLPGVNWVTSLGGVRGQMTGLTIGSGGVVTGADHTATASTNYSGGPLEITNSYWNGLSAVLDTWQWKISMANGTNPNTQLQLAHSGSSGPISLLLPYTTNFGGSTSIDSSGNLQTSGVYISSLIYSDLLQARNNGDTLTLTGRRNVNSGNPNVNITAANTLNPSDVLMRVQGSANTDFSYDGHLSVGAGGSANHTTCWKADGKTLGYCSTQPDSTGSCTCN